MTVHLFDILVIFWSLRRRFTLCSLRISHLFFLTSSHFLIFSSSLLISHFSPLSPYSLLLTTHPLTSLLATYYLLFTPYFLLYPSSFILIKLTLVTPLIFSSFLTSPSNILLPATRTFRLPSNKLSFDSTDIDLIFTRI